ncbi:hypothetical protein BCON_0328g00050 [Botryotinia convoluta]|uniref:Uncharacterized protein n=1 Tax=Botryotinia convoluta TaxID=54673 RepID=A0A4Z1HC22_9HELO|nr:hypothetical protein BCON_0328g00050 [Botryotinia convoluta]
MKVPDYQQLIGSSIQPLQETLDGNSPGKEEEEDNYGGAFMNHLKSLKQNSGCTDKGFMILGDYLEREVVYRTYVLGGQDFPESSGQYRRSEVGRKIMGGLNFDTEIAYYAVVLEKVDVDHQGYGGNERNLDDSVLMRKERGGAEREVSEMMKSMEPRQKW